MAWVRGLDGEETRGSAHRRARSPEHPTGGSRAGPLPGRLGGRGLGRGHGDGARRDPHRSGSRSSPVALVVHRSERWRTARLGRLLRVGGPDGGGVAGRGATGPRRWADVGPGLDHPRRLGHPALPRPSPVQPGPLQLRRSGPARPSRTQPLCGRSLRPRVRSSAVCRRHRVAGHHIALRSAVRGLDQGGGVGRRGIARRPGGGLPCAGADRRGPGDGVAAPPGPSSRDRSGGGPLARGPQPPGPVQLRRLRPQRLVDGRAVGGRGDAVGDRPDASRPVALCPCGHGQAPRRCRGGLPGRRRNGTASRPQAVEVARRGRGRAGRGDRRRDPGVRLRVDVDRSHRAPHPHRTAGAVHPVGLTGQRRSTRCSTRWASR